MSDERVTMALSTLLREAEKDGVVVKKVDDYSVHTFDIVYAPTRREGEVQVMGTSLLGDLLLSNLVAGA